MKFEKERLFLKMNFPNSELITLVGIDLGSPGRSVNSGVWRLEFGAWSLEFGAWRLEFGSLAESRPNSYEEIFL